MNNNILILGIGGAAFNVLQSIKKMPQHPTLANANFVVADTDPLMFNIAIDLGINTIYLNQYHDNNLSDIFNNISKVCIIVGLGGYTGSKYAIRLTQIAKDCNIESIAIFATIPFSFELKTHIERAHLSCQGLSALCDNNLFIYQNDELINKYPELNFLNAFNIADSEIAKGLDSFLFKTT